MSYLGGVVFQTDFLLVLLKDMVDTYPDLRVVLMSATIDTSLFSDYFGNVPIVEVKGRVHPVQGKNDKKRRRRRKCKCRVHFREEIVVLKGKNKDCLSGICYLCLVNYFGQCFHHKDLRKGSSYCPLHAPVSGWNWVSLMPKYAMKTSAIFID